MKGEYRCDHLPFVSILPWAEIKASVLPCGFTIDQSWGCLKRAWKGYKIAKDQEDVEKMYIYAKVIQRVEKELGIEINSFPQLGLKGDPLHIQGRSYKHKPFEAPSLLESDYFEEYDTNYVDDIEPEEIVYI